MPKNNTGALALFLLVRLVVGDLEDSLSEGDNFSELHQRLSDIPEDLEDLY